MNATNANTPATSFAAGTAGQLALRDWPLADGSQPRGVVLIVHGLGEHAGRYERLAGELNSWGFAARAYDHYGHGASEGPRGGMASDTQLTDDLARVVDNTRQRYANLPLVLLGHSLGGLVVSDFVARKLRPVDRLVVSSPALDAGMNAVQKLLIATLPKLLPNLAVGNGLKVPFISHDPAVVAAYKADPLVHDRICGRMGAYIANAGPQVIAQAAQWTTPTLLMWAGADRLVSPAGSARFAQAAPKNLVQSQCIDDLYHEIFNELDPGRANVVGLLKQWLLSKK